MAGCDYLSCEECGERLFYIGCRYDEEFSVIYCAKCYGKLVKKIERLEKAKKRGR